MFPRYWSERTVVLAWWQSWQGPSGSEISQKFCKNELLQPCEQEALDALVDIWRTRLHNISWLMKVLNEGIARCANKEGDCTGYLRESRIKSQALLDEKATPSCMSYIDLTPPELPCLHHLNNRSIPAHKCVWSTGKRMLKHRLQIQ